jgi:hypothetical protein
MELSRDEALMIANSGVWRKWSDEERFLFQINQERLCMDFSVFHESTEKALKRPVYTHEFVNPKLLLAEFEGKIPKATMTDILNRLPKNKEVILAITK